MHDRNARLATSLSGTNLVRAGDYNQRVVLQAIRLAGRTTRALLAGRTGLTVPTIANIVRRLVELDLVSELRGENGSRGQPPHVVAINPDGRFSAGLTIDRDHVTLVVLDLLGRVRVRASREVAFMLPDGVVAFCKETLDNAFSQPGLDRRRLIGLGIAMPDGLASTLLPHRPPPYGVWNETDIRRRLQDALGVPAFLENDASAAAAGEATFGLGMRYSSFFYILVSAGLGGGLVVDGSQVPGADHRAGEIGFLRSRHAPQPGGILQDVVSLSALRARLEAAGHPPAPDGSDATTRRWLRDSVSALVEPLQAINCLLNPAVILLGGRLPPPLLEEMAAALNDALGEAQGEAPDEAPRRVPRLAPVMRAALSEDAPAVGAAILPFVDQFLPLQASLMTVGRQDGGRP